MKKTLLILLPLVLLSFNEPQRQKHLYEDDTINCSYETCQGRIDGQYISYYKTGQKRSEGKFENNYRIGKWTVWDSTGKIRMQRDYSDPFTFIRLIPETPKDKPIELLNIPRYSIQKNKEGFIDYFPLKERMVVGTEWTIWRIVLPKDNPLLFDNNKLVNLINKNRLEKNITVFNEEFTEKNFLNIDTSSYKITGIKIKEQCFFDNERLVSETRILGLCPIVIHKLNQDTIDRFWVYFPHIRKYLAQEKIQQKGLPAKIETLDDLFFYRCFFGKIYNAQCWNNYESNTSCKADKESAKIEISLIEGEHEIWINYTKG